MATLTGEFAFPSFTSAVKQVSHRPYSSLLVGIMFNRWPTNNFSFVYCAWGRVKNTGMIFIEAKRYWLLMFDIKRGGIGARCEYCFSCANGVSVRVDTALTHYRPIRMTAPAQTCTRWHVQIVEYVSQNSKYIEPLQSCLKECSATFQTSTPSYRLPILRELSRLFQIYESYVSKLDPYLLKRYTAYFGGILKKTQVFGFCFGFWRCASLFHEASLISLQEEGDLSLCAPSLQTKNTEFVQCFQSVRPSISKLSTYLSAGLNGCELLILCCCVPVAFACQYVFVLLQVWSRSAMSDRRKKIYFRNSLESSMSFIYCLKVWHEKVV